jgi:N-acetylmuramic acid 6-phosphate etherase
MTTKKKSRIAKPGETKRRAPKKTDDSMLDHLATEQPNPASADLDLKSSLEIAEIMNAEDATVSATVRNALPQIARGIDWIAAALSSGGRLIYVGTGTSGRLAALDAAECPPTFNTDPNLVQFVIAGGAKALAASVEADEDSIALGVREIRKRSPTRKDVVIGVAASGRTPFTIAAVKYARSRGANTIAVTCNPDSALEKAAELGIVVETGAEVVSGSTRMKAGTAEKMVLNMLSTGAMVRMGLVYGNLMVNLHQKNSKLAARAVTIVERALSVDSDRARKALKSSGGNVPVAIVMDAAGMNRKEAQRILKSANGHVRRAVEYAKVKKLPL